MPTIWQVGIVLDFGFRRANLRRCIRVLLLHRTPKTLYLIGQPFQMEHTSAILPSDAELQLEKHDQNMGIIYNLLLGTVQVPVPAEPRRTRVIHLACEIFDKFRTHSRQYSYLWLWFPPIERPEGMIGGGIGLRAAPRVGETSSSEPKV
jgi:hypothetical protein